MIFQNQNRLVLYVHGVMFAVCQTHFISSSEAEISIL